MPVEDQSQAKEARPNAPAIPPIPAPAQQNHLEELAASLNADIFLYSGPIADDLVEQFLDSVEKQGAKENLALILTTYGGSPDAAFRLCRFVKRRYKRFYLFVPGYCKSAGTLIALGADEIVMLSRGELGPLDVQLMKQDDLTGRSSGLDVTDAIRFISEKTLEIFEDHFTTIIGKSGGSITTKTAGEIATSIAVGLMSPVTQQLDPVRLGENQRAMNIAAEYGRMLGADPDALDKLTKDYPSHGFVIDLIEAQNEKLFPNVRGPNEIESLFFDELGGFICARFEQNLTRQPSSQLLVLFLSPPETTTPSPLPENEHDQHGTRPENTQPADTPSTPPSDSPSSESVAPSDDQPVISAPLPTSDGNGGQTEQASGRGIDRVSTPS